MKLRNLLVYTMTLLLICSSCAKDQQKSTDAKETREEQKLNSDITLFSKNQGKTWGAVENANGSEILAPQYSQIKLMKDGYLLLTQVDSTTSQPLYGLSDLKGEIILKCENQEVIVDNDNIKIRRTPETLPTKYSNIRMLGDNYLLISIKDQETKKTTYGLADIKGNIILECENLDISFDKEDRKYINIKRNPNGEKRLRDKEKLAQIENDLREQEKLEREKLEKELAKYKEAERKAKLEEANRKRLGSSPVNEPETFEKENGIVLVVENASKDTEAVEDPSRVSISLAEIKRQNSDKENETDVKGVTVILKESKFDSGQAETKVELAPKYPGGEPALNKFMNANLKYPTLAQANGIQGRVVVKFVVEKTGDITDVQVIQGLDRTCDAEALRVVNAMPKWVPGTKDGENVPATVTLPVHFKMQGK